MNLHIVFHSSYTILYPHQQCTRIQLLHILVNIVLDYYYSFPSLYEVGSHCGFVLFFKKKVIYVIIYLVLPGLSCGTWTLQSSLQHVDS